jgi:hypothetical protein
MHSSKVLTTQIYLITNGFGDRQVGNPFFYWLAKIIVVKKSAKTQNAVLPVLLLAADLQTKSV